MSHDLRARPLWRIRWLLFFMSALIPLGGGCSLRDATPPNLPQGSLVGPSALKLLLPDGWVDTTAPRSSISIASAETGAGDTFSLQVSPTAWVRFEDVPLDVRERQGLAFVAFLKPSLQSQGFDDVNLLRQGNGLLNGLPAVVVDYEATKSLQTIRGRLWKTWFQGNMITAIVQSSSPDRWARVVSPFDRILADIRVPAELRRAPALLAMPPPRGWTDISVQTKARSPNTVLAFRSPSADSIVISTDRSPHGRLEDIPQHEIRTFQTEVTDGLLARFRREGYEGVDLKAPTRGVLAGLPALAIEWTATKNQHTYRARQLITWYRQRQLVVTMVAYTDRWSESAPVFEAILADPKLRAALALPVADRPAPPARALSLTTSTSTLYTNSWAVVIGIDRYQKPGLRLQYAVSDARSVQDALSRLGFPLENIVVLLDEQATKRHILEVVADDMRARTDLDDRLFVFFAGHGVTVDLPGGGQMGYLLPADGDPEHLHSTAIAMSDIREMSHLIPAKHIFFAIDACFSGLAAQRDVTAQSGRPLDLDGLARGRLREILTAGERDQPVIEAGGHGVFTRLLLEGLAGGADFAPRDGVITGQELAYWLIPRVQATSGNRQTPFFGKLDGVGDFIFVLPR